MLKLNIFAGVDQEKKLEKNFAEADLVKDGYLKYIKNS